jgi:hypothetical protein
MPSAYAFEIDKLFIHVEKMAGCHHVPPALLLLLSSFASVVDSSLLAAAVIAGRVVSIPIPVSKAQKSAKRLSNTKTSSK